MELRAPPTKLEVRRSNAEQVGALVATLISHHRLWQSDFVKQQGKEVNAPDQDEVIDRASVGND